MIALFDRAAARDFVDMYMLSSSFTKDELLRLAAEADAGYELQVLTDMLARYSDRDLSLGGANPPAIRRFFRVWTDEIRNDPAG